nr:hypothetical protein GCM10020063_019840 [Dactylosporangium thailandense]
MALAPALWCVRAARTWRALAPGLRTYARQLLHTSRTRVALLAACALTAVTLTVCGSLQDPGATPPAWLLLPIAAHALTLLAAVTVPAITTHRTTAPPQSTTAPPRPTGRTAEWGVRRAAAAAMFAFGLWMLLDPPSWASGHTPGIAAAAATLAGIRVLMRPPEDPQ